MSGSEPDHGSSSQDVSSALSGASGTPSDKSTASSETTNPVPRLDRLFAITVLISTILFPLPLALFTPFGEERERVGVIVGWVVLLLVMVPSYLLLTRTVHFENKTAFMGAFLGGSIGRMFLTVIAIIGFWFLVEERPIKSFVTTYFLGYFTLCFTEIMLAMACLPKSGTPS